MPTGTIIAAAFGAGIRTCIVKSGFPRGTYTADAGGIVTTGTLIATVMITATGIAAGAAKRKSIWPRVLSGPYCFRLHEISDR